MNEAWLRRAAPAVGIALLLSLAPIIGALTVQWAERSAMEGIRQDLESTNEATESALVAWAEARSQLAIQLAVDPTVRDAAVALSQVPLDELATHPAQAALRERMRTLLELAGFQGYFLIRTDGLSIASSRDGNLGQPNPILMLPEPMGRLRHDEAIVTRPQASDVPLSRGGRMVPGAPTMFAGAPVHGETGQVVGYLTLRMDPSQALDPLLQGGRDPAVSQTIAFGPQGTVRSAPKQLETLDRRFGTTLVPTAGSYLTDALRGGHGTTLSPTPGWRGEPVFASWRWIAPLSLTIATEHPTRQALESFHQTRTVVIIAVVAFDTMVFVVLAMLLQAGRREREARTELQSIIDAAPVAIVVRNESGLPLLINEAGKHGMLRGALPIGRAVPPGQPVSDTVQVTTANGERSIRVVHSLLPTQVGGENAVCTVGLDITEQVRATADLRALANDLEARVEARTAEALAATEAKNRFLARISHELRTPLTGVLGMLELTRKTQLDADGEDYLERAWSTASLLRTMLNEILDFSKIDSDALVLEERRFTLDEVLRPLSALVLAQHPDEAVALHVHVSPEVPCELVGDGVRVGQVLLNLVGNAAKFTERGTIIVSLSAQATPDGQLWLQGEVTDTGPGFSNEIGERLFQPFQQASATVTRTHGGTGLGLPITRRICEAMGGQIAAEGRLGQGATFRFAVQLAADGPPTCAPLSGLPVLVGVADPHTVCSITDGLAGAGIPSITWQGGALPSGPWRAVLMDAALPPMGRAALVSVATAQGCPMRMLVSPKEREQLRASEPRMSAIPSISKPALRSTLRVWLGPEPDARPEAPVALHGDVLIVEDNAVVRLLVRRILEQHGLVPTMVDSVAAALPHVDKPWHLALLDVHLGDGSGLEVVRALRNAHGPALPICTLSGDQTTETDDEQNRLGVQHRLPKPLRSGELSAVLMATLTRADHELAS